MLLYNYPAIAAAAGDLKASTGAEQVEVDGIASQMVKAGSVWGGTGSTAYQAAQTSLTKQQSAYLAASLDFAAKLEQAGASMGQTDGSVGGYWA